MLVTVLFSFADCFVICSARWRRTSSQKAARCSLVIEMLVVILSTLVCISEPTPVRSANHGLMFSDHITTVRPLARSLHRSFFTSSGQFKPVQNELAALMSVLEAVEEDRTRFQVDCNKESALCNVSRDCHGILKDLQGLKQRFDSVGTQTQRTWERLEWYVEDLADIRTRLTTTVSSLNLLYTTLIRYIYKIEIAVR
jgi:hypothetical protein